jgi:hypothetical protein
MANNFSSGTTLEELIRAMNPYKSQGDFEVDFEGVEYAEKPGSWYFKGAAEPIARAVKIPYTFVWRVNGQDVTIRDYLLVGFEGGGAY